MRLPFEFKIHPGAEATDQITSHSDGWSAGSMIGGGGGTFTLAEITQYQTSALSGAVLTCQKNNWKACFIDSKDAQIKTIPLPGPMFPLNETKQGGGGSEPWISCLLYGCCCGGSKCHT
jgi:hypothetical protein